MPAIPIILYSIVSALVIRGIVLVSNSIATSIYKAKEEKDEEDNSD